MDKTIELRQISLNELKEIISESVRIEMQNFGGTKNKKEFLSREEVASLLGVSLVSLHSYTKEGILQSYKIAGRVLYRQDEVIEAIRKVKNLKYKRNEF